jgi:tRNA dimethylallyltransferase
MVRPPLIPIIIAGATGSGKSALALKLAKKHNGEIICADSRQFFQHMRIGTASPSDEDLRTVPHAGFNSVDPMTTKIDAGFFVSFAQNAIREAQNAGRRPILVGGTGLYLRALRYGLNDVPRSDPTIVKELEEECDRIGLDQFYAKLVSIDPSSAEFIKPQDRYRIVRALEIYRQSNRPPSEIRHSFYQDVPKISAHWVIKIRPRAELWEKLEARVKLMFDEGLLDEARALRSLLPEGHWALKVMGYHEALLVLDNKMSLKDAQERIYFRHRQYAKQQNTWFKKEQFYRWHV